MTLVDDAFTSLFFGEGWPLGILVLVFLMFGFTLKYKYAGALFFPISLLMGIEYYNRNLTYQSLIMFFLCPFILIVMAYEGKRR